MACCWTHIFSLRPNLLLDPAEQRENKLLVNAVLDSEFLLVLGARASGKTTRLLRLSRLLDDLGYHCI
jgi:energy-coupling factor transporter ATP-binding protein EcfA2